MQGLICRDGQLDLIELFRLVSSPGFLGSLLELDTEETAFSRDLERNADLSINSD